MKRKSCKMRCLLAQMSAISMVSVPGGAALAALPAEASEPVEAIETYLRPLIDLFHGNPWLQGIVAIVVTFTVASFTTWLLFKLIRKVTLKTTFDLDDQIALLLRPPIYYTLLVSGFSYGVHLMPMTDGVETMATRIIQSAGVMVWVLFFVRLASLLLTRVALISHKVSFLQRRTLTLFDNGAKVIIFAAGLYAFFVIWKIDMTAWLASAGIAGIAVGFAAKDTLSNLFSGVFILADAPYKVGDYIVLDRGDRGKVINIGLRSTRILTRDDIEITIPNSIIGNTTIVNQSGGPTEKLRIRVKIGVAYGSDVDEVRAILLKVAQDEPLVCENPAPRVRFRVFGASSLDFELLCWIPNPELRGRTMDKLNDAVYKQFNRANIEIPYAKQDLYIRGLPEALLAVSQKSLNDSASKTLPQK
ncbi:mechanosensitive ion channel family protein [Desulfopila aestuarii]|nr:mechanosensitive ion channel family protein [Desulfopila aestuarii]